MPFRRQLAYGYLFTNRFFVFVLTALVLVVAYMELLRPRPYNGHEHLAKQELFPPIDASDIVTGEKISIPGHSLNFFFYLTAASPQNLQLVVYSSYLFRNFHSPDISFYLVTSDHFPIFEEMRRDGELPFPLIVDDYYRISHALKIRVSQNAFFVFRNNRSVLFAPQSGLVAPEDVRELFERYRDGKINYHPAAMIPATLIGQPFPNVTVRELSSRRELTIQEIAPPGSEDYWVFTAECPVCSLEASLPRLREAKGIIPIFSSRFSYAMLRKTASNFALQRPLYVATSELVGFENLYFDQASYEMGGLVVKTDKSGKIIDVHPVPLGD